MSLRKVLKAITFTCKSPEFHNDIKVRKIMGWLKSGHEIQVDICATEGKFKAAEKIYKDLEIQTKSGAKFANKVVKPNSIKFKIIPTQGATNFLLEATDTTIDDNSGDINDDVDVFSEDFEKELDKSIALERSRNKKKKP